MTKKRVLLGFVVLLFALIAYQLYIFYGVKNNNLQSIYLVPKDAVYIIESQKPIDNWDEISKSEVWNHLQKSDYFHQLAKNLLKVDTIFKQQKSSFDFIGNREMLISAHMYKPKDYSFFYVIDLQKIAKLSILKNNIDRIVNTNYKVSKRKYHNHEITEIYDVKSRETFYISFIQNQLIASFVHTLVEASIDEYQEPSIGRNLAFLEIRKKVGYDKLFRLYFQYQYLDEFSKYFTDESNYFINSLSENLIFSGFNFEFKNENIIAAEGYTNVSESASSYLKAVQKSGVGRRSIPKIAPKQTAIYTSFTFDSFSDFYKNFEDIQKENPQDFNTYLDNIEKVENFLKINIKDHFVSWVGNEIAILNLESPINNAKNDVAFILKVNDVKNATDNLHFIVEQIRKRTPVKFKQIDYKGYPINFMSIKGFFKLLLGDLFKGIDRPYFTIIDDYVVFSNHPNTLKYIINNYSAHQTLENAEDYKAFDRYFNSKSSVYLYINTPLLYNNAYLLANKTMKKNMKINKDFIICFPQIGFQLSSNDALFKSNLIVNYQDPTVVKNNDFYNSLFKTARSSKTRKVNSTEITEAVFIIPEIYPTDLSAKKYSIKYANGNTKLSVELKNGLKHGSYREYYRNGKLKISGKYRKDKQTGIWKAYDKEGKLAIKKRL